MFSMIKSWELNEVQTPFNFVNRRHYGEDVKFYHHIDFDPFRMILTFIPVANAYI